MRNTLLILMITVHLAGNTEIGQLIRVPQLISHFFQHHRQDQSIDFFEFIAMHYGGDDGTEADDDIDNQLPCHNVNHNTIAHVISPIVNDIPSPGLFLPVPSDRKDRLVAGISPEHVWQLLQPPRQA
jgi:hypothetical protein